ncbi:MAG TPA: MaoC/PaaZ C-terminal domain-containing protein [Galbitalea sp.]|jgi:acyl dehydratase|nr:MaoC/PaaZ C-terminal domain-containing protein [Galbitalea sp.]
MRAAPSLQPGDSPRPRTIGPITTTDIVRFAGAGGDFNPLHHDEAAAYAAGFETVIAMGQFSAGLLAGLLTDWVGIENVRALEVRFVAPVYVGDVLELLAEVTAVGNGEAQISLTAKSGDKDVTTATARVLRSSPS